MIHESAALVKHKITDYYLSDSSLLSVRDTQASGADGRLCSWLNTALIEVLESEQT